MKRSLGLAVVLAAVGACNEVTPEEAAEQAATALCERANGCATFFIEASWPDVATCAARGAIGFKAEVALADTGLSAAVLQACKDALATLPCDAFRGRTQIPEACRPRGGTRVNGAACGSSWQCQSGYCKTTQGACGVCGDRVKAGGTCSVADDCDFGLYCDPNKVCAGQAAIGQSCDPMHACVYNAYCKSGTCAAVLGEGASCEASACDVLAGLYCNASTKTCTKVPLVDVGMTCGPAATGIVACADGASCGRDSICVAPAADGAICTEGQRCLPPAECVNGACKLPDPAICG